MNRRLFNILVVSIFCITSSAEATDYVVKNIGCPNFLYVGLKLPNKIGSDPAFEVGPTSYSFPAELQGISRSGQRVSCVYTVDIGNGQSKATYSYTVKRTIIECKQLNSSTLECKLKP
jgi:hypothetical protein